MMTGITSAISRRSVLESIAGVSSLLLAGCSGRGSADRSSGGGTVFEEVVVDRTALVVSLAGAASVEQVNVIRPDDELFATRDVPAGVEEVSFDLGTAYAPGEYRILARSEEQTVGETTIAIRPEIKIRDVGLYRNNPQKPWDEVYGESKTDTRKNGEAFVTVENVGTGPEAIIKLRFTGDIPNPVDDLDGSGLYEKEQAVVAPGETVDLFSSSFPFGPLDEDGMGCDIDGNRGKFTIIVRTQVMENQISKTYRIEYSGSEKVYDCDIEISEA